MVTRGYIGLCGKEEKNWSSAFIRARDTFVVIREVDPGTAMQCKEDLSLKTQGFLTCRKGKRV